MSLTFLLPVLITGILSPVQTSQLVERYNLAQVAVTEHNHSRAVAELQSLVRDFGTSEYGDELRFALAEAQFNAGSFSRSRDLFRRILETARHDYIRPEAMLGEALSSIMLGQYDRARLTLESLSKEGGYDREARTNFAFGVLHYFLGEYEQAVTRLSGLEMPEAKFYLAKCRSAAGRPVAALLLFNEVIAEAPNTPIATMAHFAAGEALFANRDYDGARAKLQYFVDEFPQSRLADYAHYYLGCALLAQRKSAQAIGHLTPLTRHSNNYLAAHANYFLAHAHMSLDQPAEAIERYQRVRANYPNTRIAGFANLQLAQAMLATGDTAQTLLATSQLSQMFRTGDLSGVGSYLSGVILYQTGKYTDAAKQFDEILSRYTETSLREPAAAMLLLALSSAGRHEQAVALGAKYISDFPEEASEWRARTLCFLAEALYHYGKYSEADAYYQRSYTHTAASDIAPYARLGRNFCLYHLGRLGEADAGFRSLLTARPDDTLFTVFAYLGHGYSLFNQRAYTQALDIFEALANTFSDAPLAAIPGHFYAGYSYYQLGYYGQAIEAWTTLVNRFPEQNPKAAEAAFRTGDTYFKALEYDKAVASFTFVVERHPGSDFAAPSQALVAQCYYNRGQYLDAVREYQKFLDIYPSDPQAPSVRKSLEMAFYLAGTEDTVVMHDFLRRYPRSDMAAEGQFDRGKALFDQGRYGDAAVELQKVVVNFPGSAIAGDAQLLTAESYAKQQEWTDAVNGYRKFLSYFPDHTQIAGAWFNLGTAHFNAGEYQRSLEAFQTVVSNHSDSEYVESARQNIVICRQRLGAGGIGTPAEAGAEPSGTDSDPR